MKRIFKLVSCNSIEVKEKKPKLIDWSQCFICQNETTEKLTCPAEFENRYNATGYKTLAENLKAFQKLDCLPPTINVAALDHGSGFEANLRSNNAKFHKKCSLRFNSTELNRASKRIEKQKNDTNIPVATFTRRNGSSSNFTTNKCFFCDESVSKGKALHAASTFDIDRKVRLCALELEDQSLIAKLSAGDMMATDAVYHATCLTNLYNRHRSKASTQNDKGASDTFHETAFAELLTYIQNAIEEDPSKAVILKLSDIKKLYQERVIQLGGQSSEPHSTRLKIKILSYFPQLEAHKEGRDILLVSNENIGQSLRSALNYDAESEVVALARAANIVRKEIVNRSLYSFNGSFTENCQENSVPKLLATLITMILYGSNIETQANYLSQACLTICQLLVFNTTMKSRGKNCTQNLLRRDERNEMPLPLFLGALVHAKTRCRDVIETLNKLALCSTYDRILGISTDLGNSVIKHYENVGAVCPPSLNKGVFTTAAVDNIDHNPSSTSAKGSFHGTGISLFQHPENGNLGEKQMAMDFNKTGKTLTSLPFSYRNVRPVCVPKKKPNVPEIPGLGKLFDINTNVMDSEIKKEENWCKHVTAIIGLEQADQNLPVSWAAYHSRRITTIDYPIAKSALLPLFPDDSKSIAMIRHTMDVVKLILNTINPGQIPVIACDYPLFKLAKEIQWYWPETYGEKYFVIMLGGLHIKMTLLKCLGDLLDGSGWTSALEQADVASSGSANSFLKACHVKRTARAHQLTACALYNLRQKAYNEWKSNQNFDSNCESFEVWCEKQAEKNPQFQFWQLVLNIELQVLTWDRAVHEGNFLLYIESLKNIQWLFHALDHQNYAKAVSVHIRDMISLKDSHPYVFQEFCKGKFTVNKTKKPFSRMALDESHEQNNACIKGDGGAVGLTEKPSALLRWMVSGPEMARIVNEFVTSIEKNCTSNVLKHHEDVSSSQMRFLKEVKSLICTINEMGNPFKDNSGDLLVLDSRQILDKEVAFTLKNIKSLGVKQSRLFFTSRLVDRSLEFNETLKKNKLTLICKNPAIKLKSNPISSVKRDRNLFSRLYIASQNRSGNLEDFFRHENHPFPPSLSENGSLRFGNKADLTHCLEAVVKEDVSQSTVPEVDMIALDGAVIVNMIKPCSSQTFNDYANSFVSYITKQFVGSVQRLDIVFDVYIENSFKSTARNKRGKGFRMRVEGSKNVPGNWTEFLRLNENKSELFGFLCSTICQKTYPGTVIVTTGENIASSSIIPDSNELSPCTHEEADTRLLLHVLHGSKQGYKRIMIRTVDTDVVVLGVSFVPKLFCEKLYVAFGTGKHFRYVDATKVSQIIGKEKCLALPMFHALTGCDTTSSFSGRGKRTAWQVWETFEDLTTVLCKIAETPTLEIVKETLSTIERFVVLLYDRCSSESEVNNARKTLFAKKNREIENIPPTQDALHQHLLRAVYQAGHVWSQALIKDPCLPDPTNFGWITIDSTFQPMWTTLPSAGEACREMIKCGCA